MQQHRDSVQMDLLENQGYYGDSVMSRSPTTTSINLLCAVCDSETSGAHSCPGCKRFVHVPCGVLHGEEGFGSSVWCQSCLLKEKNISTQHLSSKK